MSPQTRLFDWIPAFAGMTSPAAVLAPKRASVLDVRPDLPLHAIHDAGQHHEEDHHASANLVALLELGLRGPGEEGRDIARFLRQRRLRAVGIGDAIVAERRRHRDLM